ncbi:MAG: ThuA domain-containing protein [Planctomycetaceae bacterium]
MTANSAAELTPGCGGRACCRIVVNCAISSADPAFARFHTSLRRKHIMLARFLTFVIACCILPSPPAHSADLNLNVRSRTETEQDSNRYHSLTNRVTWNAAQTAIVVCDMWDKHWCPTATERVGQMVPRMNDVITAARKKGVMIIHCPSDTLDFYKDTPQRRLAMEAPKVETKVPLQRWCHLDRTVEGDALPIDDSDGGCDCEEPFTKNHRAWTRQHPGITIADNDAVTDSAEAFYLMKQRGVTNVIVMGVHTNMCVLGRPFSIRQMVQQGQNVVLMRDMTDTMYNPTMAPFVSHFTGTDLVIDHIEQYWCPTILSTDIIGGDEFRFPADKRKHLVVLCAEQEYRTRESLPRFAREHLGHDFRVTFVWDDTADRNSLPGIEAVADADVLLISVRRRTLPAEQLKFVRDFVAAGKPVIGIRTASHAFCLRGKEPPADLENWTTFDKEIFGGNYTNHHGSGPKTTVTRPAELSPSAAEIIRDIDVRKLVGNGSLYKVSPLTDSTSPVLLGSIPNAAREPVAWFNKRSDGGTSFYTSLGHIEDFANVEFQKLLKNVLLSLARR